MIKSFRITNGLPFIELKIWKDGQSVALSRVLVDTGSVSTILKLDIVEEIGITAEPTDYLGTISGVGGKEFVFLKTIQTMEVEGLELKNFQVDIGTMEYGMDLDGIVGMDFLLQIRSIIDLNEQKLLSMYNQ